MAPFDHELYSAFRVLGLNASPRHDGGLTCCCPRCAQPTRLTLSPNAAACPDCHWQATGEAWEIAQAAAAVAVQPVTEGDGLPPLVFGDEIEEREPVLPGELIEGMLHRGAKMVLGGGSKSFKTWCLADLAICISQGRPWWGRKTHKGAVVYLNLEVQGGFFSARLRDIRRAHGLKLDRNLVVWNLRGHTTDHTELLPKLSERLKGMNLAAIVLDPTYKVMARSENAQEEVAALMASIERLALETGAAVIFGSHFAKGNASGKESMDRISGSGVFARDPDAILTMTRHEEDDVFVIEPVLRNCPPVAPFAVRWQFPLMVPEPNADVKALRGLPGARPKVKVTTADVCDVLARRGGIIRGGEKVAGGIFEAIKEECGAGRRVIEHAIKASVDAGIVEIQQIEDDGRYVKIYKLKEK